MTKHIWIYGAEIERDELPCWGSYELLRVVCFDWVRRKKYGL